MIPYENGYERPKRLPKQDLLQRVDDSGRTAEERIVKFCETPRGKKEIAGLLGISVKSCTWVWQKYLEPLITINKLKMTIPTNRASKNQRFVSGDAIVSTEEAILEFCDKPRTRTEIAEHFGLTTWTSWTQIHPLVERGKLKQEHPNRGATGGLQRLTTHESLTLILTDESLKEFCSTPRR